MLIGSARVDEKGQYTGGLAGDQKQTTTPDMSGEVSQQSFYNHKKGWNVLRAKDKSIGERLALSMRTACNNPNVGYSQSDRYGIMKYGTSTTTPCNCDCSSLVRRCVLEATGVDTGDFNTATEVKAIMRTGLFDKLVYVKGMDLRLGDILVTQTKGHTVIVTDADNQTSKTLRKGDVGEDVKWLQNKLKEAGYDFSQHGGIDGIFGSWTDKCLCDFQRVYRLDITGEVDDKTRAALESVNISENTMQFGIDVSKYQGVIDWAKVKTSGTGDFAVLKCTKKNNQIEESFARNYSGCKAAGIPIAVYRYVYAKSVGAAVEEANGILAVLKGRPIEGEVWLDMEDDSLRSIGKAALSVIINTESDILKAHGFKVGIYCNRDWYEHVLDGKGLSEKYKFWIAKFGKNTGNGSWKNRADDPKDIAYAWQYTSKGTVQGIQGYVDLDLIY